MTNRSRTVAIATAAAAILAAVFTHSPQAAAQPAATPEQRIARLEAGVERAEAVRAIKRLQYTHHHYLAAGLWDELATLYTASATADFNAGKAEGGGPSGLNGRDAIKKHWMQQAGRTANGLADGQLNHYLILQPVVNLGPTGLTGQATFHEVAMTGQYQKQGEWSGGIYENDYVFEGGAWKIQAIHFYHQYRGAYEEPGQKSPPFWNIQYHYTPEHLGVTIPESAMSLPSTPKGTPEQRLANVNARLRQMNDEADVQNLHHIYAYYIDRKMWDDVADLFTADGTFESGQRGVYQGPKQIRQAFETLYEGPGLRYGELWDHLNLGTITTISPDGKTANVRATELAQLGLNNVYARWELGTYENEFVKDNGVWKIRAVHYYPRLITDYDKGWPKEGQPAPGPSTALKPAKAPTAKYEIYPKFSFATFHYANPATGKAVKYPAGAIKAPTAGTGALKTEPVTNLDAALKKAERDLLANIGYDATENHMSTYGYFLDESAWDAVSDAFDTRGIFELSSVGIYIGRDRMRESLKLRYPPPPAGSPPRPKTSYTIHQLAQPVIHMSEDGTQARARLRLFQMGGSAARGTWIGGIYENAGIFEDGEWKMHVKDLQHTFSAPYPNGWAKYPDRNAAPAKPAAAPKPAAQAKGKAPAAKQAPLAERFPIDRPERSRQYAFPEIDEPAFHYKNPVSGRMPPVYLEPFPPLPPHPAAR